MPDLCLYLPAVAVSDVLDSPSERVYLFLLLLYHFRYIRQGQLGRRLEVVEERIVPAGRVKIFFGVDAGASPCIGSSMESPSESSLGFMSGPGLAYSAGQPGSIPAFSA